MLDLWTEINGLVDKPLKTLSKQHAFVIKKVDGENVHIVLEKSQHNYLVPRAQFDGAWEDLDIVHELSRAAVRQNHSHYYAPYVTAVLAALPGVTTVTKPTIKLSYGQPPVAKQGE